MRRDLPDELSDVTCTVRDFNSGGFIASGRLSLQFARQTDRLRKMRFLFSGEFIPDTPADKEGLDDALVSGFSAGAAAHRVEAEYGGRTWVLVVKFEPGERAFPFTGRNEPKPMV